MASNLLWAHLLRKDATTTGEALSQIPPIAPQDKTATSMRMLIHDTQVNLEKFSARLDGLFQRVDDCRAQVVNANKLLDVERDKVLTETLEIAHRCQAEMKAHVGTPAQASALELAHTSQVSTEKSVSALEKRIDALQTLLQAHAHTMQAIQDQQSTLISAQMDQVKAMAALPDMVADAVSTMTKSIDNVRSALLAELARGLTRGPSRSGSRRRPSTQANVSPLNDRGSGPKRPRLEGIRRLTSPATPRTPRQPLADLPLDPGPEPLRVGRVCEYVQTRPAASGQPVVPTRMSRSPQPGHSAPSKAIKIEEILKPSLTGVFSVDSSPLSTPPPSLPRHEAVFSAEQQSRSMPGPLPEPAPSNADGSPPKSMSLRDRRAQMSRIGRTETRRFIQLVPWSDEEE